MNTENNEISINNVITSQLASMIKKILTECANNINNNFDILKNSNDGDRLNVINELFGLDKEFTCKLKPKENKGTAGTNTTSRSKTNKKKEIPLPFWGKIDPCP